MNCLLNVEPLTSEMYLYLYLWEHDSESLFDEVILLDFRGNGLPTLESAYHMSYRTHGFNLKAH